MKVFVAVADVDALVKRQPAIDAPLDLFEYADERAAALRILQAGLSTEFESATPILLGHAARPAEPPPLHGRARRQHFISASERGLARMAQPALRSAA